MIGRLIRIDARRPASWIAFVVTAIVAGSGCRVDAPLAAAACGGLLGVAASGDLRMAAARGELAIIRTVARAIWPLTGLTVSGLVVGSSAWVACLAGGLVASSACSTAAAAARGWPASTRWLAAVLPPGGGRSDSWIDRLAMPSMLAAMAICYFLMPELAGWYAAVALAWFVLLAVPRATLWGGEAAARSRLAGSAPGRPRPPGTALDATRHLSASVALLCWPAIVALVLQRDLAWSIAGPAAAIALLVVVATVAAAVAAVTEWRQLPADTTLAAAAATLAGVIAWAAQLS